MSNIYTYLIQDCNGLIKIGQSKNVKKRIQQLQTAHGKKLKLLAYCLADKYLEKRLHRMFFFHRKQGEWFDCSSEIKTTIINYMRERYPTTSYE
jgi:hypothetical protein